MVKNRSYGDRGTGYTPRKQSIPGTSNEKRYGRGARWCKDADVMYQFKNMTYIYVDNVSEKLQLL